MHEESYGALFQGNPARRITRLERRIENVIDRGVTSPRSKAKLAKLMALRDALIAKTAAKKGAALAAASIPGIAGGLASSGIRGMDVIEHEFTPAVIREHNIDGAAQGLRQTSVAPPGSGRLVPINFINPAATGANVNNPVVTVTGATGVGAFTALETRPINWAVLRIVALTTQTTPSATGAHGVMQDFKIGGSPGLFLAEDMVLMDDYDTDKEQFTGLRAYPILISPNNAFVDIAAFSVAADDLYAMVSLVTEVMRDDAFGPGLPGAYAR